MQTTGSSSDLALFILDALKMLNLSRSICHFFRHVGVEPFDQSHIFDMIKNEKPEESLLSNPQVHLAVTMTCEYLESCETLSAAKRKYDEQEKEKRKKYKNGVDTSFAIVMTDPTAIATIQVGAKMTEIKKLNATDLHVEMIRMGWVLKDIQKPDKNQFKNMKEL